MSGAKLWLGVRERMIVSWLPKLELEFRERIMVSKSWGSCEPEVMVSCLERFLLTNRGRWFSFCREVIAGTVGCCEKYEDDAPKLDGVCGPVLGVGG